MLPIIDQGEECFYRDKLRQKQGSIIMREKFSDEITAANALSTIDLLGWAFDKFHPRLALASSFQAEASVLIDLI